MTTFVMNKKTKKKSYNEHKEVKVILIVELKTARHVVSWFTNVRLDCCFQWGFARQIQLQGGVSTVVHPRERNNIAHKINTHQKYNELL